jgi:hypothetical protein
MVKHSEKGKNGDGKQGQLEIQLRNDVDALFAVPLEGFTPARNALVAKLKKEGRVDDAERVKGLVKPSISAWAVNQLWWKQREAFDRLIAAGEEFRLAQTSQLTGKSTEIRGPGDARRRAVSDLTRLAAALLRDGGHNPTPDIMRRITTTLEAISAYASVPAAHTPGRLTSDVAAPGFDALTALFSDPGTPPAKGPASIFTFPVSRPKDSAKAEVDKSEKTNQAKIAAAKTSLRDAESALKKARTKAEAAQLALEKASAEAMRAEKQRLAAEQGFYKATAASEEAARHARIKEGEATEATKSAVNAELAVQKASNDLKSLLRQ